MERKHTFVYILVSFLLCYVLSAQDGSLHKTFLLPTPPVVYATDIQQNFYLGFEDGTLLKYDSEGSLLLSYSLPNQSAITLIDAQNPLKTFLFYFDNQQIIVLDRFNTIPKAYELSDFGVSLGLMVCPTPDENFWVVENNPMRIKKIDPRSSTTLLEIQVEIEGNIKYMRTYKNLLIISADHKLYLFDQYGSEMASLDVPALPFFQLVDDQILYSNSGEYLLLDPFSMRTTRKEMPVMDGDVIIRTDFLITISGRKVVVYKP